MMPVIPDLDVRELTEQPVRRHVHIGGRQSMTVGTELDRLERLLIEFVAELLDEGVDRKLKAYPVQIAEAAIDQARVTVELTWGNRKGAWEEPDFWQNRIDPFIAVEVHHGEPQLSPTT